MKMIKKLVIFCLLLLVYNNLKAQNIVISEYFNSDDQSKEWIELLVINDNFNLVNSTLKDSKLNNGIPDVWSGGIQFNDNQLWRHLRSGTIIVIRLRGIEEIDVDKSDGYIEIGAENTTYFTKITLMGNWDDNALNITDLSEIFQLSDISGNHIHSLSHIDNPAGVYNDIPNPKLCFKGSCLKEASVSVCPGKNINEYNGGQQSNLISMNANSTYITKGFPNKKQNYTDDNLNYWKKLRQPNWENPVLTSNIKPTSIELFWNICDDLNPVDLFQGYLIVRINLKDSANAQHPKNGTSYKKGDMIGSAFVVGSFSNSLLSSTSDNFTFDCNDAYEYRVYAYRYNQDNLLGNSISSNYARGRTYLVESYASQVIKKFRPIKPSLTNLSGNNSFCATDSVFLSVTATGGPFEFTWYLNNVEITGAKKNRLSAYQPGIYKVRITNEKGCFNESDAIELIQLPTPESKIEISGKTILNDTVIVICEGETLNLKISGGERYEWFKDSNLLTNSTDSMLVNSEGLYFAIAINNNMECKDTSAKIFVNQLNIAYSFDRDSLFFNLDKYTPYQDENVIITNSSSDTLRFLQIIIPPGGGIYSLSTPPPAEVVEPFTEKTYRVRFEPDRAGQFIDSLTFILPCNNSIKRVYLFGYKEAMNVIAQPDNLSFKDKIFCDNKNEFITIHFSNFEDFPVEIQTPVLPNGFKIVSPSFPLTLDKNNFRSINIEFTAIKPGFYSGIAVVSFVGNGIKDKFYFELSGKVLSANFKIERNYVAIDTIVFPNLIGCEDSATSSIKIYNDGEVDLVIDYQDITGIYLPDLPIQIRKGDSIETHIVFVPEFEGQFAGVLNIISNPCNLKIPILIIGSKNGITYGLNKRNVSFGNVINCRDSGSVSQSIDLIITGDSKEKPKITKIIGPSLPIFTHDFQIGKELSDSTNYQIIFNSAPDGEYYDTIKIMLNPCDIEKIIPLYGNRINPLINLNIDTLFFNNVEVETSDTTYIEIENNSSIPIKIDSIETFIQPFNLLTNFPIVIEPDSSNKVYIKYSPLVVRNDTLKVAIYENEPCIFKKDLFIIGNGAEHKIIKILINSYNYYTEKIGSEVEVIFNIKSLDKRHLSEALIDSISFNIEYNPTILFPKSIRDGDAIISANPNLTFIESIPGITTIHAKLLEPNLVKDGTLFGLKFLTLLGNSLKTNIDITNLYFSSKIRIDTETDDTYFEVVDECNIKNKLINYENFNLLIASKITTENLEFTIEAKQDSKIFATLFNSIGLQEKKLIESIITKGAHFFSVNISDLPKGVYILVVGNQFNIQSEKILLVE